MGTGTPCTPHSRCPRRSPPGSFRVPQQPWPRRSLRVAGCPQHQRVVLVTRASTPSTLSSLEGAFRVCSRSGAHLFSTPEVSTPLMGLRCPDGLWAPARKAPRTTCPCLVLLPLLAPAVGLWVSLQPLALSPPLCCTPFSPCLGSGTDVSAPGVGWGFRGSPGGTSRTESVPSLYCPRLLKVARAGAWKPVRDGGQLWGPDPKAGAPWAGCHLAMLGSHAGDRHFPHKTWADCWAHKKGKANLGPSCQALASSGPEKSNWRGHGGTSRPVGAGGQPMGRGRQ